MNKEPFLPRNVGFVKWEKFDPCGATTDEGIECEGAVGHLSIMHWYSIWSFDKESEEWYPAHPVYFD